MGLGMEKNTGGGAETGPRPVLSFLGAKKTRAPEKHSSSHGPFPHLPSLGPPGVPVTCRTDVNVWMCLVLKRARADRVYPEGSCKSGPRANVQP
jgi:hypothetical protein